MNIKLVDSQSFFSMRGYSLEAKYDFYFHVDEIPYQVLLNISMENFIEKEIKEKNILIHNLKTQIKIKNYDSSRNNQKTIYNKEIKEMEEKILQHQKNLDELNFKIDSTENMEIKAVTQEITLNMLSREVGWVEIRNKCSKSDISAEITVRDHSKDNKEAQLSLVVDIFQEHALEEAKNFIRKIVPDTNNIVSL